MTGPTSVLFVAPEPLRPSLTGPTRRAVKLAQVVAEHCRVTLAAPAPSVFPEGPFRTVETGPLHDQRLGEALAGHDVAVVQTLPSPRLLAAARNAPHLVVDLLAPFALEVWETHPEGPARAAAVRWRTKEMVAHLAAADLVLCSNERQRDLVIGAALAGGVLGPGRAERPLHERIVVVPHGIDEQPPVRRSSPLRANGPLGEHDRIAIWAGGIWSWLDPLTAIRAMERLRRERPDLKLAFVGLHHPDPVQRRAHAPLADEAVAYVRDRGLDDAVMFRPRWLSREEYVEHLQDADVGISLHGDGLENRYASRTRVLDYLYAGLPVVCSGGDTLSDLVASRALGRVVDPHDVQGCADALDELTREPRPAGRHAALEPLFWRSVAQPLVDFCRDPGPAAERSLRSSLARAAGEYPAFLRSVYHSDGGAAGIARAAADRLGIRVDR